jgi:hypothetical protein
MVFFIYQPFLEEMFWTQRISDPSWNNGYLPYLPLKDLWQNLTDLRVQVTNGNLVKRIQTFIYIKPSQNIFYKLLVTTCFMRSTFLI